MASVTLNENTNIGIEVINGDQTVSVAVRRITTNINMFDNVLRVNYQIVVLLSNGGERVYKQINTDYSNIDLSKCGDNPDPAEIVKKLAVEKTALDTANSEATTLANTLFG